MEDNYPDEQELDYIRNFDILKEHPINLVKYIREIWWPFNHDDQEGKYSTFTIEEKEAEFTDQKVYWVECSTVGWSGNESILDALEDCKSFNSIFHVQWRRGGHNIYEIPIKWGK